jgi:hypothetical protein
LIEFLENLPPMCDDEAEEGDSGAVKNRYSRGENPLLL